MKKTSILIVLVAGVALVMGGMGVGSTAECGEDGYSPADHRGSCESPGNELQCGEGGTETPVASVWADADGVDVCNDGDGFPIQGRAGAGADCQCIFADGTANNPGQLSGWIRIDMDGVDCSTAGSQSYNQPGGGFESCG